MILHLLYPASNHPKESALKKSTYILLGSLMAVSLGGYLLTETPEPMPARILMQNAGGRVVFDHAGHIGKYDIACIDCHHDAASSEKAGLAFSESW